MCEYCKELKSLYWDSKHPFVRELYIELDHTISIALCETETCEGVSISGIKINYCPMCGVKF